MIEERVMCAALLYTIFCWMCWCCYSKLCLFTAITIRFVEEGVHAHTCAILKVY